MKKQIEKYFKLVNLFFVSWDSSEYLDKASLLYILCVLILSN